MGTKRMKLTETPDHINKYLTHWTGREKTEQQAFDILSKIIDTRKLKFNQNKNSAPWLDF